MCKARVEGRDETLLPYWLSENGSAHPSAQYSRPRHKQISRVLAQWGPFQKENKTKYKSKNKQTPK